MTMKQHLPDCDLPIDAGIAYAGAGMNVYEALRPAFVEHNGTRIAFIACNYFYGSLHFVVTAGVMTFLYRKFPDEYPLWRNTLAVSTAIALIGFTFWPLMPPRLMPDPTLPKNWPVRTKTALRLSPS